MYGAAVGNLNIKAQKLLYLCTDSQDSQGLMGIHKRDACPKVAKVVVVNVASVIYGRKL